MYAWRFGALDRLPLTIFSSERSPWISRGAAGVGANGRRPDGADDDDGADDGSAGGASVVGGSESTSLSDISGVGSGVKSGVNNCLSFGPADSFSLPLCDDVVGVGGVEGVEGAFGLC